jgi:hypothetical protein
MDINPAYPVDITAAQHDEVRKLILETGDVDMTPVHTALQIPHNVPTLKAFHAARCTYTQ